MVKISKNKCETRLEKVNLALQKEIAERKQAEFSAKTREQQMHAVLETLPVYLVLLTPDYHVPFANRFFRERFGESKGRKCYQYLFGRRKPCKNCQTFKVFKTKKPHRWEWLGPDGRNYAIYDFPFNDSDGSPLVMEMGIDVTEQKTAEANLLQTQTHLEETVEKRTKDLKDKNIQLSAEIADRKKAEKALRENQKKMDRAQEIAHLGSWELDIVNNRLTWSDEVYRIFGLKPQEFKATYEAFLQRIHPADRKMVDEAYSDSIRQDKDTYEIEHRVVDKSTGEIRYVHEKCEHVKDKSGRIVRSIGMVHDLTEQKRTEEKLRETKDFLENLLDYTNAPIIVWDRQMKISRFNRAFERLTGLKSAEVLDKKLDILFPEEHREKSLTHIRRAMRGEYWQTVEIPIIHKNGKIHTLLWNSANIYDKNGKATATIAQGHDITGRKKAERKLDILLNKLREGKRQMEGLIIENTLEKNILNTLMENTEAQMAYLDRDFNFIKVNSAYCRGCGMSEKELIGRNHFEIFPDKENLKVFQTARDKGRAIKYLARPFVFKKQAERGTTYWDWTLTPLQAKNGNVTGLILSLFDVTERIKASKTLEKHAKDLEKLNAELKKFQQAVENASDIIFIIDPAGNILYANKTVENLLGYEKEDIIGKKPYFWENSSIASFFKKVSRYLKASGNIFSDEIVNIKKDGGKIITQLHISPVFDEKKEILFLIGIERDITEAKEIDKAKTEFLSLAAHQLRTPLASISLASEVLLSEAAGKDEDSKKYLEEIFSNTHKMADLIGLFLSVARLELGKLEINPKLLNVVSTTEEIVNQFTSQLKSKGLILRKDFSQNIPTVKIDIKVLNLALENIISNAIKYTPSGGLITVALKKIEPNIVFEVSDTGCGIPKNQQSKVFSKLFRGSNVSETAKGIGIGMYVTKNTIEQAGGKIWLKSKENKGTTFYISLPLGGMKKSLAKPL